MADTGSSVSGLAARGGITAGLAERGGGAKLGTIGVGAVRTEAGNSGSVVNASATPVTAWRKRLRLLPVDSSSPGERGGGSAPEVADAGPRAGSESRDSSSALSDSPYESVRS